MFVQPFFYQHKVLIRWKGPIQLLPLHESLSTLFIRIFPLFQFNVVVNIDEFVITLLLVHECKTVEQPVVFPLIMVADVIIALMIERKIQFSSIDPQEYYCKPSILHILIIMANVIFCISFLFLVISDSVLGTAIFITVWYYCIDVYVFTYIYFNVPKRNYAIRYIKKIFTPSPRLIQIPIV